MNEAAELARILEQARVRAFSDGYKAGVRHARDAINDAMANLGSGSKCHNPESPDFSIETPDGKAVADEAKTAGNRYPQTRARRGERDDRAMEIARENHKPMTEAAFREEFERRGDDVSPSSLRVVLKRLVDQGRLRRDGRNYVLAERSSDGEAASDLPSETAPTSDLNRRFTNGTALNEERAMSG